MILPQIIDAAIKGNKEALSIIIELGIKDARLIQELTNKIKKLAPKEAATSGILPVLIEADEKAATVILMDLAVQIKPSDAESLRYHQANSSVYWSHFNKTLARNDLKESAKLAYLGVVTQFFSTSGSEQWLKEVDKTMRQPHSKAILKALKAFKAKLEERLSDEAGNIQFD